MSETLRRLYPEEYADEERNGSLGYGPCDYQPMLDFFGEIIIQVDDEDYQGDSRVLYKDGDKYGYLNFGWGSCSGCDSLQACESMKEVGELMDSLKKSIIWFDNKNDALEYFKNKDWETEYSWHADETKDFVNKVINYL